MSKERLGKSERETSELYAILQEAEGRVYGNRKATGNRDGSCGKSQGCDAPLSNGS